MATIVNDLVSYLACGEVIARNDAIYISQVDGKIYKYSPLDQTQVFAGIAKEAGVPDDVIKVVQTGRVRGFTGLPAGQFIYASTTVPGGYQTVEPIPSQKIILGIAKSDTELTINGGLGIKPGGAGEGGGGLDVYHIQDFEGLSDLSDFDTGNDPDFLGGGTLQGTLELDELTPISKTKSLKYTQVAGSLNDYFASPVINLDPKQIDNTSGMSFYFKYDGSDNDGKFIVWDVDNGQEISNGVSFVKIANNSTRYQLSFYVPSTCNRIQWGYQVLVENVGKVLEMDDVEFSTNPFMVMESGGSVSVLSPSDTFSTDTAQLNWAAPAQYNLTTLENAPIGTYITFQYAQNTNTRTQCTTRPTQTDADMNVNGMQIFTRAYNAASTAAQPAAIAIQIGKGMKGTSLGVYKSLGKVTGGVLDYFQGTNDTFAQGVRIRDYNESTGILLVDLAPQSTSNTIANLLFDDLTTQTSGYLTINAGRTLPLLAVPTPLVAYLKDVKPSGTAGGTFTAGAWQTRTLNTVEGDSQIVSLNANQFTLGPGKYLIEASAPAYGVVNNQIRLQDVTNSLTKALGTIVQTASGVNTASSNSLLNCSLNIQSTTNFEIQHRCSTTGNNTGFGVGDLNNWGSNVFTQVKISKIG